MHAYAQDKKEMTHAYKRNAMEDHCCFMEAKLYKESAKLWLIILVRWLLIVKRWMYAGAIYTPHLVHTLYGANQTQAQAWKSA